MFFTKDVVAKSLPRLTPDRQVWLRAMAKDVVLCSCARHLTQVPLTVAGLTSRPHRIALLLDASCSTNQSLAPRVMSKSSANLCLNRLYSFQCYSFQTALRIMIMRLPVLITLLSFSTGSIVTNIAFTSQSRIVFPDLLRVLGCFSSGFEIKTTDRFLPKTNVNS